MSVGEVQNMTASSSSPTKPEPPKLIHKRGGYMTASPNRYKRARVEHAEPTSALNRTSGVSKSDQTFLCSLSSAVESTFQPGPRRAPPQSPSTPRSAKNPSVQRASSKKPRRFISPPPSLITPYKEQISAKPLARKSAGGRLSAKTANLKPELAEVVRDLVAAKPELARKSQKRKATTTDIEYIIVSDSDDDISPQPVGEITSPTPRMFFNTHNPYTIL